jgi:hypothetical protein
MIAVLGEKLRDFLHIDSVIKRCGISNFPFVGRNLQMGVESF